MQGKSKRIFAITGTPGAGKSHFARMLSAALSRNMISNVVIELNDIVIKAHAYYREDENGSKVVNSNKLSAALRAELRKTPELNVIIVGHLVPELKLKPAICFVIRVPLKRLARRLEARAYGLAKIRENIISEAMDYCGSAMRGNAKEIYEIETGIEKREAINYLVSKLLGGKATPAPKKSKKDHFTELKSIISGGNRYKL
ncbi:AAA family ATPase [Candidatus Marsarchaeota archaeon]|nr:AAA family ATPase [Candidatus Marsarchaeota archaeon]MCL5404386.1 AAA family ATPase [Candidatus Marsarchaeota archaeon]